MRKCFALLLAAVMLFALAACSSKNETPSAAPASQETPAGTAAENAAPETEAEAADNSGSDLAIEGNTWHAFVNVGDYLTVRTGVKDNDKENDPMRYLDYSGLCVEYDFIFGEDGVMTVEVCENQDAFDAALYDIVKQALAQYYEGVIAQKGLTVSVDKYMEMEKVDIDHYVKVGTHTGDLHGATNFANNMFPDTANYVVDGGSNAIYWSTTYSDARLFDAGVKWSYTASGNEITITEQSGTCGSGIDEWAGLNSNSKITASEATVYPMVLVKK